jgi:aldose 1-epimerase
MWSSLALAASFILPVLCQNSTNSSVPVGAYPLSVYTLTAENITAKFIPYGARLTSLLVQDRNGDYQDVVAGYDNPQQYITDSESEYCTAWVCERSRALTAEQPISPTSVPL